MSGDSVLSLLNLIQNFFMALREVPKWRFTLAFILLGEDVSLRLKEVYGKSLHSK